MLAKTVVAGVMGYPAKKEQPAAMAPLATASFPSIKDKAIFFPNRIFYKITQTDHQSKHNFEYKNN
jgi:hypothetical protein